MVCVCVCERECDVCVMYCTHTHIHTHTHAYTSLFFICTIVCVQKVLISGSLDGTLRIWDTVTNKPKTVLYGHQKGIMCDV